MTEVQRVNRPEFPVRVYECTPVFGVLALHPRADALAVFIRADAIISLLSRGPLAKLRRSIAIPFSITVSHEHAWLFKSCVCNAPCCAITHETNSGVCISICKVLSKVGPSGGLEWAVSKDQS